MIKDDKEGEKEGEDQPNPNEAEIGGGATDIEQQSEVAENKPIKKKDDDEISEVDEDDIVVF